jgi:isocitrate lyase
MPIWRARCIPTRVCIRQTAFLQWSNGSTTRCCGLDQIRHLEGRHNIHWLAPIVADAEAGFGGPLNVFELIKAWKKKLDDSTIARFQRELGAMGY